LTSTPVTYYSYNVDLLTLPPQCNTWLELWFR